MQLPEIIKEIRKRTGESQKTLAAALNVSFATVNRWETGRNEPTPLAMDGLRAYCKRKGIDYAEMEGIRQAEEICRRHRREGRFFDEIISAGGA